MRKLSYYKKLCIISLFFICIVLFIGYWNVSILLIPCLIVIGLWLLYKLNNHKLLKLQMTDLTLLVLVGYEIINYLTSLYQPNSKIFLCDFIVVAGSVFIFNRISSYKIYLLFVIYIFTFFFTTLNLIMFFFRFFEASFYGFEDFSQCRYLYTPMGLLSNEWVTLLFCFLPFSISCISVTQNNQLTEKFKFVRKPLFTGIIMLGVGIIIFNLFISFSRGGYLAFIVFVVILNYLFVKFKVIGLKKIIIGNSILISTFLILSFCFYPTIESTFGQTLSHKMSTEGRIKQWSSTKEMIKAYPFFGVGSKNYTLVNEIYQKKHIETAFTGRVNNTYIQIIIEKGIIGLILYLSIFLYFLSSSYNKIIKTTDLTEKVFAIVILTSIIAILIREAFFSSIFYNNGILLLMFILFMFNFENSFEFVIPNRLRSLTIIILFLPLLTVVFFYIKQFSNERFYGNFIESFNAGQYDTAFYNINEIRKKNVDNSLYESCFGLILERQISKNVDYDFINNIKLTENEDEMLAKSIRSYKEACKLNPYDPFYINNLGWLYFMKNQPDSAIKYISKSITLNPNIALFHISKGIMIEKNHIVDAFDEYKKAIILSPDILDSQFYKQLVKRHLMNSNILLNQVYHELLILQKKENSPIIKARIGKILLELNKVDSAYHIFTEVTNELPNLNRPWYYLGLINEKKGLVKDMISCYQKSLYLEFSDYLPRYRLAKYYSRIKDFKNAQYYHKSTRIFWKKKQSQHSFLSKRTYYLETVKDDIIPTGLYKYIMPDTVSADTKYHIN